MRNTEYWTTSVGPGWQPIIRNLISDIEDAMHLNDTNRFIIHQVKEKFGGLRFYSSYEGIEAFVDTVVELIAAAERACDNTCEVCGKPGELRERSWLKVLCDEHNT